MYVSFRLTLNYYLIRTTGWGLFALRGYQLYGAPQKNDTYLKAAIDIAKNSSYYWDDTCGGGVLWLTYDPGYKNTITNTYVEHSLPVCVPLH